MFDTRTLLEVLALPIGVAIVIAAILLFITRSHTSESPQLRLGGLIVPISYLAAHLVHFARPDWTNWRMVDAWQWIVPAAIAAALAIIIDVLASRGWLRWLIRLILVAALTIVSLQSYIEHTWQRGQAIIWIAALSIGGAAWWAVVQYAASADKQSWFSIQWLLLTIASGAIFVLSGSQRLLEMTMMLGAPIGVAMILQLIGRRALAAGIFAAAPIILFGLWLNAYFYASEAAWWRVLVPAAAPLAGLLAIWPPLTRIRSSRLRGTLTTAAILAILAAAVVPAAMMYEPNPYGGY